MTTATFARLLGLIAFTALLASFAIAPLVHAVGELQIAGVGR